jgi:hypothetical protein
MMIAAEVRSSMLGDAVSMMVNPAMSTSAFDWLASMMAGTAMPTGGVDGGVDVDLAAGVEVDGGVDVEWRCRIDGHG